MNHHAIHYSPPRPPVLFRFASDTDRQAWIDEHPGFRRAIAPPSDLTGYVREHCIRDGAPVWFEFRLATIDDLAQPVTALRDAMIDRLKCAAVSRPDGIDEYGYRFEDVDLEELTVRYMRQHRSDVADGYGAETPENHYALALLGLTTGRYSLIETEDGPRYRIPEWSPYSLDQIAGREAETITTS